jgi:hypothetical protein
MLPTFEELYKPYSKDAPLDKTMEWLMKQAASNGVPDAIRDTAITEVFLEMAKGKSFPTDHCDCGCEFPVKWSCVAMNHYTLRRMLEKKTAVASAASKLLQDALFASILDHIHRENERYVAEQEIAVLSVANGGGGAGSRESSIPPNGTRHKFTDWSRSPVLNGLNRVIRWTGSLLAV